MEKEEMKRPELEDLYRNSSQDVITKFKKT